MVKNASTRRKNADKGKKPSKSMSRHTGQRHPKRNDSTQGINAFQVERATETAISEGETSVCPVAKACGGCAHVDVDYSAQLVAKDTFIASLFTDAGFSDAQIRPILGMKDPYHYRNKVTSPFAPGKRGPNGGRQILTGMYAAGSHNIIPTEACLLENERAQQVIRTVKSLMLKFGIAPYDENRGSGFMRHAIIRVGHESGEVLVTLVTNAEAFPNSKAFCRELVKRCPFITTVVQNVNLRQTNVILGQKETRLYGPGFILDTLCGLSFRISSQSFYQVNATQTEVLYNQAITLAGLDGSQDVVDAYCGTGTIGLVAAKNGARNVMGVDTVESAIRDARQNARHNGVQNAQFVTADAAEFMEEQAGAGASTDVVFMDPPRQGSNERFLDALSALAPARVVYISCNPQTQVRDLAYLANHGYEVQVVQPVDMFPHTNHVETVVLLRGES